MLSAQEELPWKMQKDIEPQVGCDVASQSKSQATQLVLALILHFLTCCRELRQRTTEDLRRLGQVSSKAPTELHMRASCFGQLLG